MPDKSNEPLDCVFEAACALLVLSKVDSNADMFGMRLLLVEISNFICRQVCILRGEPV